MQLTQWQANDRTQVQKNENKRSIVKIKVSGYKLNILGQPRYGGNPRKVSETVPGPEDSFASRWEDFNDGYVSEWHLRWV